MPRDITLVQSEHGQVLRRGLYRRLIDAATGGGAHAGARRVLDVGAGRGEVLAGLVAAGHHAVGIDPDAACAATASRWAPCYTCGVYDAPKAFADTVFDAVVCSHVLEHLDDPLAALTSLTEIRAERYVLAVPNVVRPARIMRAMAGSAQADHAWHLWGWGRPEFDALLRRGGFQPVAWVGDRVTLNPLSGRAGARLSHGLGWLEERLLLRLCPMLSSSLIAVCHKIANRADATPAPKSRAACVELGQ